MKKKKSDITNLNWKLDSFFFSIISIIQFFILTIIAMIFYPGGTLLNPNSVGYSFFLNFFSDLGRTKSLSGESNLISYAIYIVTCSILGISLIPFSIAWSFYFKGTKLESILSYSIIVLSILTSIFMLASVFMTWDIYKNIHLLLGIIYTTFLVLTIFIIAIAILVNKTFPNNYAIILFGYFIFATINLLVVMTLRYEPINEINLMIQVTIQKITVYSTLLCFLLLEFKALKLEKKSSLNLK